MSLVLHRRAFLAGLGASVSSAALARPPFLRGGQPAAVVLDNLLTTFTVENTEAATSPGYMRIGLPFVPGDVPAGSRIKIRQNDVDIAAQCDQIASRMAGDHAGSRYFMTACFRDTAFSASENRSYEVLVEAGEFDNSSSVTLADALTGTDFKIDVTSLIGSTTGAQADHVISLNTMVSDHPVTRVTQYEKGPVCDSWRVWGMFKDASTSAEHVHLKGIAYISAWKDASGAIIGRQIAFELAQNWWAVTGKEKLTYVAALKNGATTLETYLGTYNSDGVTKKGFVEHPYKSHWITVRQANDNHHATRPWVAAGVNMPTLLYKPDRQYWIDTGLMPPLLLSRTPTMPVDYVTGPAITTSTLVYKPNEYQPCSPHAHRANEDGTGAYPGRGMVSNIDSVAFVKQTAEDVRTMRVNALVGLHIPIHFRSEKTRTRPGDGASDIADTAIAALIHHESGASTPSDYYDFTANGMPTPAHAYANTTDVPYKDSYAAVSGGYAVGASAWVPSPANSHASPHSYFGYLLEGERHLLESVIDNGVASVVKQSSLAGAGSITWTQYPGVPTTRWAGLATRAAVNVRAAGFGANVLSNMCICPNDDVHGPYVRRLIENNARFLDAHLQYPTADGAAAGIWMLGGGGSSGPTSPWMDSGVNPLGFLTAFGKTGDVRWRNIAEFASQATIWYGTENVVAHAAAYSFQSREGMISAYDPTTNPFFVPPHHFERTLDPGTISASTGFITTGATRSDVTLTQGDRVIVLDCIQAAQSTPSTVPSELTIGTIYYVAQPTGKTTDPWRIATNPDGTGLISFGTDYTNVWFGFISQKANDPAHYLGTIYTSDEYMWMLRAVMVQLKRYGHSTVSPAAIQTALDRYDVFATAFYNPTNPVFPGGGPNGTFTTWDYSA